MNLAHTYPCIRMRRGVERSNDTEPLPLRPFCRGYIIATRGNDFREGQVTGSYVSASSDTSWAAKPWTSTKTGPPNILQPIRLEYPIRLGAVMGKKAKPNRVTEHDVAHAACIVLATRPYREGSIKVLVNDIPSQLTLSAADLARSKTRPTEAMWEQQIRNIRSHHKSPGNFIYEGFLESIKGGLRLTEAGRLRLEHRGLI